MTINALITKALTNKDIVSLLNFPDVLLETFEVEMVKWISEYSIKHGSNPTLDRFKKEFQLFVEDFSNDPISDIYEQALLKRRNIHVRRVLEQKQEDLRNGVDPLPIIQALYEEINQGDSDVIYYTTYDRTEYLKPIRSVKFGIHILDNLTGGLQSGDLAYIIGRLNTGKTTLALYIVSNWLLQGQKILVIPNETRAQSVIGKIDAALAGFNPAKLRTRKWEDDEKERVLALSSVLKGHSGEIVISKKPVNDTTQVDALIKKHKPDVTLIDGAYLMGQGGNNATWERVSAVSRSLKTIAMENETAIFGVHQSKRKVGSRAVDEAEDASYSDAIGQDADLLISINHAEEDKLLVHMAKNRDNSMADFFVKFFFDRMSVKLYGAI